MEGTGRSGKKAGVVTRQVGYFTAQLQLKERLVKKVFSALFLFQEAISLNSSILTSGYSSPESNLFFPSKGDFAIVIS